MKPCPDDFNGSFMCGVAGLCLVRLRKKSINRMLDVQWHRGPDVVAVFTG